MHQACIAEASNDGGPVVRIRGTCSPRGVSAQTGSVQGTVVDAATGRALQSAQVSVEATGVGGLTNASGRFLLLNVPVGQQSVSVVMIGYEQQQQTVTVQAGQTASVEFRMESSALELDEMIVTGTAGGSQRRAIGNVVTSVNADQIIAQSPITSVDQLIGQRTPGLTMLPGTGQVGTGTAPVIRGVASISQGNDPIIYIDGVRMDSDPRRGTGQRGGSNISRLNDIHPADIESIEIIKGPAAATLYGTEASNGVIQIITKSGRTGAPQFDFTTRIGTNWLWDPEGRTDMRWMPDPDLVGAPQTVDDLFGINVYTNERRERQRADLPERPHAELQPERARRHRRDPLLRFGVEHTTTSVSSTGTGASGSRCAPTSRR
jgi:TonB-dependent SusC/RagA subfamily outer membrane receptor